MEEEVGRWEHYWSDKEGERHGWKMGQAQAVLPPSKLKSFLLLSPRNNSCSPSKEKGPEE